MDKNLQRNNVARQVEGFCISYFAALMRALFVSYLISALLMSAFFIFCLIVVFIMHAYFVLYLLVTVTLVMHSLFILYLSLTLVNAFSVYFQCSP